MQILIVGAGAIGCAMAVKLSKIGQVTILTRRSQAVDLFKEISLSNLDGSIEECRPEVVTTLESDEWDLVLMCVRAYDLEDTLARVLPFVKESTPILALTNGIVVDQMTALAGDRGVCASVDFGVGVRQEGKYYIKIDGGIKIGDTVGGSVANRIKDMIADAIEVEVVDDIVASTYSKLIINSIITYTAVVTGALLRDIISNCKEVLNEIIYEAYAVAKASGIEPASYRKIGFRAFCRRDFIGGGFRACVWKYMADNYGDRTSTTAERIASGMKSEVDYITGYVVSLGKKVGKPTPINEAILDMVKRVERGELTPSISNLTGLISSY